MSQFYTLQQISDILSAIVTLDSQKTKTGTKKRLQSRLRDRTLMVEHSPNKLLALYASHW